MIDPATRTVALPALPFDLAAVPRMTVTACGSAYYAGLVARHWLEAEARVPGDADVASELRYREPPLQPGGLALLVSQSGETADTLAALRSLRGAGQHVLSVLNVPESTMARESDAVLETLAGQEIGVASTKAFTAQLRDAGVPCDWHRAGARHDGRGARNQAGGRAARAAEPGVGHAGDRPVGRRRAGWRRRGTCCSWHAARASRSPWRARSS